MTMLISKSEKGISSNLIWYIFTSEQISITRDYSSILTCEQTVYMQVNLARRDFNSCTLYIICINIHLPTLKLLVERVGHVKSLGKIMKIGMEIPRHTSPSAICMF